MLIPRILTALLLAPLAALGIVLTPDWLFALLFALILLGAQWEWTRLCGLRAPAVRGALLAITAILFAVLWAARAAPGLWWAVIAAGVAWWLLSLLWLRGYSFGAAPNRENRALKWLAGLFMLVPAWTAAATMHASVPDGHWWVLLTLVIVWVADSGAYFSGRLFGRRKLAPRISPGKTWAGVYGALVGGALMAALGGWWLDVRGVALAGLVVLALCTVAISIVGDLFESLMKRHADLKDSGGLFPGHGGLLDRMDSMFAALPVFALGKLLLGL
jgi:phosphatidate cytidylyltransferase